MLEVLNMSFLMLFATFFGGGIGFFFGETPNVVITSAKVSFTSAISIGVLALLQQLIDKI